MRWLELQHGVLAALRRGARGELAEKLHSFFFFSSRRRHTRFDCDWSSDVCSSDLRKLPARKRGRARKPRPLGSIGLLELPCLAFSLEPALLPEGLTVPPSPRNGESSDRKSVV